MSIPLTKLPYGADSLAPYISAETMKIHHSKHHKGYVDKVNKQLVGTAQADAALEEIIRYAHISGDTSLLNNAAQSWNHGFYWHSLSPQGGKLPEGKLAGAIKEQFGGLKALIDSMQASGEAHFASGWVWLVATTEGKLSVEDSHDADIPWLHEASTNPLLVLDVWEHAYYLDRKNERAAYLKAVLGKLANWQFASQNYERARHWTYPR
jgi:superoxide dismutase, Fe-Mn family